MRLVPALLVLAAALAALPTATAQTAAPDSLPEGCTYDACALRVEPGWFSRDIVQGVDGVRVGRFGLVGSDLEEAVTGSEYAVEQAREHDRQHRLAVLSGLASSALIVLSATYAVAESNADLESAGALGALALGFASFRFQLNAERALSRAVWEYNRVLPRDE